MSDKPVYMHTSSPYASDENIACATCGTDHPAGQLIRRRVTNTDGPHFEVSYLCPEPCEAPLLVVSAAEVELGRVTAELKESRHEKTVLEARFDELHRDYKHAAADRDRLQFSERRYKDDAMRLGFKVAKLEHELSKMTERFNLSETHVAKLGEELEQTRTLYRDLRAKQATIEVAENIFNVGALRPAQAKVERLEAHASHLETLLDEAKAAHEADRVALGEEIEGLTVAVMELEKDEQRLADRIWVLNAENDQLREDLLNSAQAVIARQESFSKSNDATMLVTLKRELDAAYADVRAIDAERRMYKAQVNALLATIEARPSEVKPAYVVTLNAPTVLGTPEGAAKFVETFAKAQK